MLWRRGAPAFNRARLPNSTAISAGPSLAAAAAIDPRSGNMLRSLPRISRAELALHKRPQTDERRGQPLPPQQSPLGWRVRTQPTARSSPRRSPHTSGFAGSGRSPPLPIAAAERSGPVCRVPSSRSPRCSAGRQQIPVPTEAQPAIANALCPPFPRGSRATAAAARTTSRRTPRLLPSEASAVSHRSPCSTAGALPDSPSVIGPPVALTVSLPCDSCYLFEASDQAFPDQVIDDQHGGKHQGHVPVVRCPMS